MVSWNRDLIASVLFIFNDPCGCLRIRSSKCSSETVVLCSDTSLTSRIRLSTSSLAICLSISPDNLDNLVVYEIIKYSLFRLICILHIEAIHSNKDHQSSLRSIRPRVTMSELKTLEGYQHKNCVWTITAQKSGLFNKGAEIKRSLNYHV